MIAEFLLIKLDYSKNNLWVTNWHLILTRKMF